MARTLNEKRRKMMLEESVYKVIPLIAVPMIISMLIDSLYNLADTYFVSQLGKTATAAVGINDSLTHFIRSVALGFGMGASSYISRLLGAKRDKEANYVASTAFFTSLGVMVVLALIGYAFLEPIVDLLGATPNVRPYSIDYANFILISAPFTAGEVVLSQLLRAEGSTKLSMIGMTSGCIINVGLDPLFINTFGLEVAGAAIATTISKAIGFTILLVPYLRKRTMIELSFRGFKPSKSIYKEIARMGIPSFLRSSMMTVAVVITNNFAGGFGDAALAAHTISAKCTRLVASGIMGFGQGFQPVAGYCWGAKRYKRVREAFWACSLIGLVASVVLGVLLFVFARELVVIFEKEDPEVIRLSMLFIRSQAITMIFHVWGMVVNGIFQAIGRAISAAIIGLARQVIFLIPSVIILSLTVGVNGLAVSQAAADALCMLIAVPLIIRLFREMKGMKDAESDEELE